MGERRPKLGSGERAQPRRRKPNALSDATQIESELRGLAHQLQRGGQSRLPKARLGRGQYRFEVPAWVGPAQ